MAKVGRPAVGENKKRQVSLRLSPEALAFYSRFPKPSTKMREVLEAYADGEG